ncbi:hypothetical protein EYF80_008729 [Liparis tanakae]|uniref:Uncharacterized protein n=1 Tax=Liparis tanakae TaxID=230148 RepID=A0A4Z2IV33_9TELE|nr:hypothetical protein EYF80_008729 [Liparis tanakae]
MEGRHKRMIYRLGDQHDINTLSSPLQAKPVQSRSASTADALPPLGPSAPRPLGPSFPRSLGPSAPRPLGSLPA